MKQKMMGLFIAGFIVGWLSAVAVKNGCSEKEPSSNVPKPLPRQEISKNIRERPIIQKPIIQTLPYSWNVSQTMITIYEVFQANSNTQEGFVSEEDEQYKVRIGFKNLTHQTIECNASVGYLRLFTNKENLLGSGLGCRFAKSFGPRAKVSNRLPDLGFI
jgi:hypothetical protein